MFPWRTINGTVYQVVNIDCHETLLHVFTNCGLSISIERNSPEFFSLLKDSPFGLLLGEFELLHESHFADTYVFSDTEIEGGGNQHEESLSGFSDGSSDIESSSQTQPDSMPLETDHEMGRDEDEEGLLVSEMDDEIYSEEGELEYSDVEWEE